MKVSYTQMESENLHKYLIAIHQYIKKELGKSLKYDEIIIIEEELLENYILGSTEIIDEKWLGKNNEEGKHNIRASLNILSNVGNGRIKGKGFLEYNKSKGIYFVTDKFKDYIFLKI